MDVLFLHTPAYPAPQPETPYPTAWEFDTAIPSQDRAIRESIHH